MKLNIQWLVKKNPDWIVAELLDGAVKYSEVSINRVNKKGEVFPNFDDLQPGRDVEGELWKSSAGKHYLFAPRASKTPANPAYKSNMIKEAQDRKKGDIEHFQTNKEESIKLAGAQRDAVLIVTTIMSQIGDYSEEVIKHEIIKYRNWFLSEDFTNAPPF